MTPSKRKPESALGRGLDALIRPEIVEDEEKTLLEPKNNEKVRKSTTNKSIKKDKTQKRPASRSSKKSEPRTKTKSPQRDIQTLERVKNSQVDKGIVEDVILEVHKNPRISLWSAKSAAVLRLLKKTKPEFSISKEASALIEDAVKDKYPDLWEVFEDRNLK